MLAQCVGLFILMRDTGFESDIFHFEPLFCYLDQERLTEIQKIHTQVSKPRA